MRVTTGRENGELTVISSQILHYFDGVRVQKFYQQMHVQYVSDPDAGGDSTIVHWAVSNWGPGIEATWTRSAVTSGSDLKGGIKVEGHSARYMAETACARIVNGKINKGYKHQVTLHEHDGLVPCNRLLTELGLSKGPVKVDRVQFKSESSITDESFLDLEEIIGKTATLVLTALASGDLPVAIAYRKELLDTMARLRTVQEGAQGRMEMLNAKLAEAIR